jgi:hypothetical protein
VKENKPILIIKNYGAGRDMQYWIDPKFPVLVEDPKKWKK